MGLQARGTAGVDSVSTGGTFDISNADRLGKSETQLVNIFIEGVAQIIRWEQGKWFWSVFLNPKNDQNEHLSKSLKKALEAGEDIEEAVSLAALPVKY